MTPDPVSAQNKAPCFWAPRARHTSVIGTTDPHKTNDIGLCGHSNANNLGMQQQWDLLTGLGLGPRTLGIEGPWGPQVTSDIEMGSPFP